MPRRLIISNYILSLFVLRRSKTPPLRAEMNTALVFRPWEPWALALMGFILFLLSGCATVYNPATQKREFVLIDTQDEIVLGRDMDKQIRKKMKVLQDANKRDRLKNMGLKMGSVSDRQDLEYTFEVIDDKEFNAFAMPGGFIYVNSGLMDAATDDELACVLGHEIGHVAARHSVKRLQTQLGYQFLMSIAMGVSGQQQIGQAVDVAFNLASLGYSRKDESFADKLAVRYAKRAFFNPNGMVTFLQKLQKEAERKGGRLNIELFSSHPDIAARIKNVEKEIASSL